MQYRLQSLLVLMAVLPPMLAYIWFRFVGLILISVGLVGVWLLVEFMFRLAVRLNND